MAAIIFDVGEAERRLLHAGASKELAEAAADLISEAVVHNLDALVSREYLDHALDAKFSRQQADIAKRFHAIDSRFMDLKGQFRLMQAIQALLVAGVFLPQLTALFS